jgi:DeoR/GlpR family transcriptional regulator of sugar metabolism
MGDSLDQSRSGSFTQCCQSDQSNRYVVVMFAAERRQVILEIVRADGMVSMRELARRVQTSEVTVRRDLRYLEAEGLLDRRRGGAVALGVLAHEPTYSEKTRLAAAEKTAIASAAAALVSDGDVLVIGAGTTTQALARQLVGRRELTVVTNSLLVAQALARARSVDVVMTGGSLRGSIFALVGSAAEHSLAEFYTAKAFISGNGLTARRGLSTPNPLVAAVDRAIAAAAAEVIVLADHTKIGVDTMVQTVPTTRIRRLITDGKADQAELVRLREHGMEIDVVTPAAPTGQDAEPVLADPAERA